MNIRIANKNDLNWMKKFFIDEWGGDFIVSRGKIYRCENLDGFIAEEKGKKLGLITFSVKNKEMEIVSFNSIKQEQGIGTKLLIKAINFGKKNKTKRIFLLTTNDNLNALKFYQKRNFQIVKVHANSVKKARKLKPLIPEIGENGIPLRDEIELEYNAR